MGLVVAYIGNFEPAHSTETHVARAWEHNGHEVIRCQEGAGSWGAAAATLDRADILMWTRTGDLCKRTPDRVKLEVLHRFADAGVPSVAYHLDRWWGLHREPQVRREPFFRCEVVITADGGHDPEWAAAGVNHRWLPPGVSLAECEPGRVLPEFSADVAFVGSWQGYHDEWQHRAELVRFLKAAGAAMWPRPGEHAVRNDALRDLYASTKVNVGDSCMVGGTPNYWSDRIPETLGRGGFLLHPDTPGLSDHFTPDEHLVTWTLGDWAELRRLIDYYLGHTEEREAIAAAGRAHVMEHHTYERRMAQVVDLLVADGHLDRERVAA